MQCCRDYDEQLSKKVVLGLERDRLVIDDILIGFNMQTRNAVYVTLERIAFSQEVSLIFTSFANIRSLHLGIPTGPKGSLKVATKEPQACWKWFWCFADAGDSLMLHFETSNLPKIWLKCTFLFLLHFTTWWSHEVANFWATGRVINWKSMKLRLTVQIVSFYDLTPIFLRFLKALADKFNPQVIVKSLKFFQTKSSFRFGKSNLPLAYQSGDLWPSDLPCEIKFLRIVIQFLTSLMCIGSLFIRLMPQSSQILIKRLVVRRDFAWSVFSQDVHW